jgi:predicted Zn-ribbon and HTH transcriptional regulator
MTEEKTTLQYIETLLLRRPQMNPGSIRDALADHEINVTKDEVMDYVDELVEHTDHEFMVAPPECNNCDFTEFGDLWNLPSQCPECRSSHIEDPVIKVQ